MQTMDIKMDQVLDILTKLTPETAKDLIREPIPSIDDNANNS